MFDNSQQPNSTTLPISINEEAAKKANNSEIQNKVIVQNTNTIENPNEKVAQKTNETESQRKERIFTVIQKDEKLIHLIPLLTEQPNCHLDIIIAELYSKNNEVNKKAFGEKIRSLQVKNIFELRNIIIDQIKERNPWLLDIVSPMNRDKLYDQFKKSQDYTELSTYLNDTVTEDEVIKKLKDGNEIEKKQEEYRNAYGAEIESVVKILFELEPKLKKTALTNSQQQSAVNQQTEKTGVATAASTTTTANASAAKSTQSVNVPSTASKNTGNNNAPTPPEAVNAKEIVNKNSSANSVPKPQTTITATPRNVVQKPAVEIQEAKKKAEEAKRKADEAKKKEEVAKREAEIEKKKAAEAKKKEEAAEREAKRKAEAEFLSTITITRKKPDNTQDPSPSTQKTATPEEPVNNSNKRKADAEKADEPATKKAKISENTKKTTTTTTSKSAETINEKTLSKNKDKEGDKQKEKSEGEKSKKRKRKDTTYETESSSDDESDDFSNESDQELDLKQPAKKPKTSTTTEKTVSNNNAETKKNANEENKDAKNSLAAKIREAFPADITALEKIKTEELLTRIYRLKTTETIIIASCLPPTLIHLLVRRTSGNNAAHIKAALNKALFATKKETANKYFAKRKDLFAKITGLKFSSKGDLVSEEIDSILHKLQEIKLEDALKVVGEKYYFHVDTANKLSGEKSRESKKRDYEKLLEFVRKNYQYSDEKILAEFRGENNEKINKVSEYFRFVKRTSLPKIRALLRKEELPQGVSSVVNLSKNKVSIENKLKKIYAYNKRRNIWCFSYALMHAYIQTFKETIKTVNDLAVALQDLLKDESISRDEIKRYFEKLKSKLENLPENDSLVSYLIENSFNDACAKVGNDLYFKDRSPQYKVKIDDEEQSDLEEETEDNVLSDDGGKPDVIDEEIKGEIKQICKKYFAKKIENKRNEKFTKEEQIIVLQQLKEYMKKNPRCTRQSIADSFYVKLERKNIATNKKAIVEIKAWKDGKSVKGFLFRKKTSVEDIRESIRQEYLAKNMSELKDMANDKKKLKENIIWLIQYNTNKSVDYVPLAMWHAYMIAAEDIGTVEELASEFEEVFSQSTLQAYFIRMLGSKSEKTFTDLKATSLEMADETYGDKYWKVTTEASQKAKNKQKKSAVQSDNDSEQEEIIVTTTTTTTSKSTPVKATSDQPSADKRAVEMIILSEDQTKLDDGEEYEPGVEASYDQDDNAENITSTSINNMNTAPAVINSTVSSEDSTAIISSTSVFVVNLPVIRSPNTNITNTPTLGSINNNITSISTITSTPNTNVMATPLVNIPGNNPSSVPTLQDTRSDIEKEIDEISKEQDSLKKATKIENFWKRNNEKILDDYVLLIRFYPVLTSQNKTIFKSIYEKIQGTLLADRDDRKTLAALLSFDKSPFFNQCCDLLKDTAIEEEAIKAVIETINNKDILSRIKKRPDFSGNKLIVGLCANRISTLSTEHEKLKQATKTIVVGGYGFLSPGSTTPRSESLQQVASVSSATPNNMLPNSNSVTPRQEMK